MLNGVKRNEASLKLTRYCDSSLHFVSLRMTIMFLQNWDAPVIYL